MRVVGRLLDRRALGRGVKARPAAVGVELGLGFEQLRAAAGAQVNARRLRVPVLARERPFGALLTQHVVLGRGQVSLPLGFALLNFALLQDRKSTRLNSSHSQISYAVFCLKKKNSYTHKVS